MPNSIHHVKGWPMDPSPSKPATDDEGSSNLQDDGSHQLIETQELLRVIGATLYSLGLNKTVATLESEANFQVNSNATLQLRGLIIQGNWQGSLQKLEEIEMTDAERVRVSYVILKQKYLELLQAGKQPDAVRALREIGALGVEKEKILPLSSLLLRRPLYVPAREKLLIELEKLLPPGLFVEKRLVELVEQALLSQKESCIYHNSAPQKMTLFRDHRCGSDKLPCKTWQIARDHKGGICHMQFSKNGKFLASCDESDAIIWRVYEGHLIMKHRLNGHDGSIAHLCWNPEDSQLLTCGYDGARRWDIVSGQCLATFTKNGVPMLSCAWTKDEKGVSIIFTGHNDESISMWTAQGSEITNWSNRTVKKSDLGISANKEIVSIRDMSTISLFSWETEAEKTVEETTIVVSFSMSSDHRRLVVSLSNKSISLWNIEGRPKQIKLFKDNEILDFDCGVCFGGFDEAFIASANRDSRVRIWHKSSGELVATLDGHQEAVMCVCWNPTIPTMLVSGGASGRIRVWGTSDDD